MGQCVCYLHCGYDAALLIVTYQVWTEGASVYTILYSDHGAQTIIPNVFVTVRHTD